MTQDLNPLNPSISFSTQPPSYKTTLLQKLLSVRIILIATCTFQVILLCSVMYGFTYYSERQITNDLSSKILKSVVKPSAADTTMNRFALPYFVAEGSYTQLPTGNHTMENLRPYFWLLFKQANGKLRDYYWSNTRGDCTGYYVSNDGILYEMYCNKSESIDSFLFPVTDWDTGLGDRSNPVLLPNYSVPFYNWWQAAYNSPGTESTWSPVYKDLNFPGVLWITLCTKLIDQLTNETSILMVDVTSESLQVDYEDVHISDNAIIFLMQNDGTLVACSDPTEQTYADDITIYSAYDSNIELVRETSRRIRDENKTESRVNFILHGKTINAYYILLRDLKLEFKLVVAYPISDFFGVVTTTRKILLSVSSGAFILSLIVVMLLITRPLTRLGKLMEEIARGVFEPAALQKISSNTTKLYEIHLLQEDFNRMVNALKAFGRFVPVDIVRYLLRNNAEAVVNMRQKEITVLFSDIKNFTTKVEEMSPAQLSLLLSDYLNTMCSVIAETEGTVDKFIGDAVMALWNVPAPVNNHVLLACSAALKSLMGLDQLNRKWNAIGLPCVEVRIGIHTGNALVGNLGSQERLAFTAVGDSINLGARLESLNKKYGTTILISGEVYEHAKEHFLCRYLDVVIVVGKTNHTHVYELVNYLDKTSDKQRKLCAAQADALSLFLGKQFDAALRVYDWLHAEMPDDISIKMLMKRAIKAQQLGENLPADWSGYLVLQDK